MSIQGPASSPIPSFPDVATARPGAAPSAARPAAAPGTAAAPNPLWNLLTDDERAFFTQQATLGAVTYRPSRSGAPATTPAPTGGRVDVRA